LLSLFFFGLFVCLSIIYVYVYNIIFISFSCI
jgi:hypothetical protein